MASKKSIWYHIGRAYERSRHAPVRRAESGLKRPARHRAAEREMAWPAADDLVGAAAWLVLDRVVGSVAKRRRPRFTDLIKAGAAGAAAALLVDLIRPLLLDDPDVLPLDEHTIDRVLLGAGQGLVYGALVEPRIPGPALMKGAVYGSVEFATDQLGGLSELLEPHTPQGRVPLVGDLLSAGDDHERAYLEHLVFGIALALLYDPRRSSNGIRHEVEDDEL